jgi:excisionase family DNA binding protein
MNNEGQKKFFDMQEAAEFLNIDIEEVKRLVIEKQIPHSKFPGGQIRFWPDRLMDWGLSFEKDSEYNIKTSYMIENEGRSLISEICKRFNYKKRKSKEYINLCFAQRAFAQLHPRPNNDGVDLALRECGEDSNLRGFSLFARTEINQLNGYTKTNKNWLKGTQHTNQPAAAFQIPKSLLNEKESNGWKEMQALLEYAKDKLEKQLREKNLLKTRKIDL